jgi:hypothetical protein
VSHYSRPRTRKAREPVYGNTLTLSAEPAPKTVWGVYPHATWTGAEVRETGPEHPHHTPGYVVRAVGMVVPYRDMMPLRQFTSEKLAQKAADRFNARHGY